MLTNYDNIVFDLGGVLLTLDRDLCVKNLEALGLSDAASLLDLYKQSGDFLALEEGHMWAAEFLDRQRARCSNASVTNMQITEAVNSFITGLPVERLQALRELKSAGKRLFTLSNTNPVMFPTRIAELFRGEGLEMDDYFEGHILSYREKVCKPAPAIFHRLLTRYGLDPERTIFLDDSGKNCEAAEQEGIRSVLIPEGAEFMDILKVID